VGGWRWDVVERVGVGDERKRASRRVSTRHAGGVRHVGGQVWITLPESRKLLGQAFVAY